MADGIVYVDGKFYPASEAKISVFDHGLLYGDGVFEGIRFYNRRIFKLENHLDRLARSASLINLTLPFPKEEIQSIVVDTASRSRFKDGYLRPVITRGEGDLGLDPRKAKKSSLVVICSTISLYGKKHETGITAIISSVRRTPAIALNPNIKSLNYLNNIMAKSEANARGADEAILLDTDAYVAEASADNIFLVKGGVLYTPPTTTNLMGITRATVIELSQGHYPVKEMRFQRDFLLSADEVFVTGTGCELSPVVNIDGQKIKDGQPGPVATDLRKRYLELVRSTGTMIPGLPS